MAQTETYRCWYRDGSARLVNAEDHRNAAEQAQELATISNAPAPSKDDKVEYKRYIDACKVKTTERLSDGNKVNWK